MRAIRQNKSLRDFVSQGVVHLLLLAASLLSVLPMLWTLILSLKPPQQVMRVPASLIFQPTLESYELVLFKEMGFMHVNVWSFARNSVSVSILAMMVTVVVACLAGYAISRFRFPGRRQIGFLIIVTRLLPPIAAIVPLYLLMAQLGLLDTYGALVLAYSVIQAPFAIWLIIGFLESIPIELDEAAMIDGCSRLAILWKIIVPLVAPGILAVALLVFLGCWSDYEIALTLTSRFSVTLPLMISAFLLPTEGDIVWGAVCAVGILMLIPPILFTLFFSRFLISGLTMGAVKS